ncbi:MAG TPA: tRNA pseudouridine(55) synthase TruB [Vicinamibacterales bacterium]|mgnify:CR=1 FL=1|nr:tRNA pseudouridine(55) synthase TruB [Vicinamibacterales bacterium]
MTSGVLVLDKPPGPTSHDMVAVARRALGERRIGHCGTLDPMATGVLVLAVGQATRLARFLSADDKHYEAAIRFGRVTATFDGTGPVVAESAARPTRETVAAALSGYRGSFLQTPPAYSAKKVAGERAYDVVRRAGAALELEPVLVTVRELELTAFDGDVAHLSMRVSAGFYVRSLAHDLGQALGMGAVLEGLRRTQSGTFGLEEAVTVEVLTAADRATLVERLLPLERLLPQLPSVPLTAEAAASARRGLDVRAPAAWPATVPLARLMDERGHLLAIAKPGPRAGFLHPFVVLN